MSVIGCQSKGNVPDKREPSIYACPYCGAGLAIRPDSLSCIACKRTFEILDGVPCFKEDKNYYYGEVPQDTMQRLLTAARAGEWQPEFERVLEEMQYPAYHRHYALSERRAGWWPLLDIGPESRVLDWGCGWGPISYALVKRAGSVMACDACLERLQFLRIRALQEGNTKIQFAWAGDTPRFPFRDGQFDLVVLNGVLEWVTMTRKGNPGAIQKEFLREVARVLSAQGQLMLAMENRYNLYYFLGKPEDHAQLRYVSLMPRRMAATYSKLRKGQEYRNWTYSYWAHKRILKSVGFNDVDVLVPLADYREFQMITDPARPETVTQYFRERNAGRSTALVARAEAAAAKLLSPSFCVIAQRGKKTDSFVQALGGEIGRSIWQDTNPNIIWRQFRITRSDAVLFEIQNRDSVRSAVVTIPFNATAEARCRRGFDAMRTVRSKVSPEIACKIPEPFISGVFRGTPYFVRSVHPGISASCFAKSPRHAEKWKPMAVEFLVGLHRQTAIPKRLDADSWKHLVLPHISTGLGIVEQQLHIESEKLEAFLMERLINNVWPFSISHGDFWAGNLLVVKNATELSAVIDWEYAEVEPALPFLDILHASVFSRAESQQKAVPTLIGEALASGRSSFWDASMMTSYLSKVGYELTEEQFQAFFVLYWIHLISVKRTLGLSENLGSLDWMRLYVEPATPWIKELIKMPQSL